MRHNLQLARTRRAPAQRPRVPDAGKAVRGTIIRMALARLRPAANDNDEDLRRRLIGAGPIADRLAVAAAILAFALIPGRALVALVQAVS